MGLGLCLSYGGLSSSHRQGMKGLLGSRLQEDVRLLAPDVDGVLGEQGRALQLPWLSPRDAMRERGVESLQRA